MAYPSLLDRYAAVTVMPDDLHSLLEEMKPGNSRSLLSFLADNLPAVVFGKRHHRERIVHLTEPMWWEISSRGGFMRDVPSFSVDSAVVTLNAYLKARTFYYRVWRQCHNGDPKHHKKFRPVAPYVIGLVDMSRPLAPEPVEGLQKA